MKKISNKFYYKTYKIKKQKLQKKNVFIKGKKIAKNLYFYQKKTTLASICTSLCFCLIHFAINIVCLH